jgi:hypothetical protein
MSGSTRISGVVAALAISGVLLGACVAPGAGLSGSAVRDENHAPNAAPAGGRDTDKIATDTGAFVALPPRITHSTKPRLTQSVDTSPLLPPSVTHRMQQR